MWSLLLATVVVGIAFALVTSARKSLMAESESAARPCGGCSPGIHCPHCPHAYRRKHR